MTIRVDIMASDISRSKKRKEKKGNGIENSSGIAPKSDVLTALDNNKNVETTEILRDSCRPPLFF